MIKIFHHKDTKAQRFQEFISVLNPTLLRVSASPREPSSPEHKDHNPKSYLPSIIADEVGE
jgi:hypothetical protein